MTHELGNDGARVSCLVKCLLRSPSENTNRLALYLRSVYPEAAIDTRLVSEQMSRNCQRTDPYQFCIKSLSIAHSVRVAMEIVQNNYEVYEVPSLNVPLAIIDHAGI